MSIRSQASVLAVPLAFAALLSAPYPAFARETDGPPQADGDTSLPAPAHAEDGPTIVVLGRQIAGSHDPLAPPVVLSGDALVRETHPQIGEMLATLPGVSSSSFAPGASRPVLRGLDGPRVQVLADGLGSLDASSISADHAVSLDTLTIDRVDVLHGPQVLLYSSDPSAGVVNAATKRIPLRVPEAGMSLDVLASAGSAANSGDLGAAAEVRLAPRWVARLDGGYSRSSDLRTGGSILSAGLRDDILAQASTLRQDGDLLAATTLEKQADARGRIANSWARQWTAGAGLAFVDDGGTIGLAAQRLSTDYGIPPRPGPEAGGKVSIALRQTRIDLRAGINLSGFIDRVDFRGAYGDYRHVEADDGVPATTFANRAMEARLDLIQARRGGWSGSSSLQVGTGRLDVSGEEALLPDSTTEHAAAASLQRLSLGRFDLEGAGRFEHVAVRPIPSDGQSRQFDLLSIAGGVAWHPLDRLTLSASLSRGQRAPSSEELFIDGVHDATQSFELGDPGLRRETSTSFEAGVRYHSPNLSLSGTVYATRFAGFIAAIPTGEVREGFPVFAIEQHRARFTGFETEAEVTLVRWNDSALRLTAGADGVRARLAGIGPVPRIPPLRVRGGIAREGGAFDIRAEVEWNARQDRVAANEYPVGAFTLVNLGATWRPPHMDGRLSFDLAVDNLLDASGRRAASETRDFVPIAGRNIKLTAKYSL